MLRNIITIIFALACWKSVYANYTWVTQGYSGGVICEDKKIIFDQPLPKDCIVITSKNGFLNLKEKNSNLSITVGPLSRVLVKEKNFELHEGSMRVEGQGELTIKKGEFLSERTQGSQLYFSSRVFGELEALSLKGDIFFKEGFSGEQDETKDKYKYVKTKIPKGSWVSVGGRFGKSLGDFYELSKSQIDHFNEFLLPPSTSSKYRE